MQHPKDFYSEEKQKYERGLARLKRQLTTSGTLRLFIFLLTTFGIYFFFGMYSTMVLVALAGISFFVYLLVRHNKLQYERDLTAQLVKINQVEIDALTGNYSNLEEGSEFIDPTHFYSHDIDLFGVGSFFQYINRTTTTEGKALLAKTLTENDISNIDSKQEAIKDLALKPKWRQQFSAIASLVKVDHSAQAILKWIQGYKPILSGFISWLPTAFSLASVAIIGLAIAQIMSANIVLLWFFIGLGISGFYFKKINDSYKNADKAKSTFKQYHILLQQIESENFKAQLLQDQQNKIKTATKKASAIFARFSRLLDALDQRNNIIIAILGNAFFLRDLQIGYKIEKWLTEYATKVESWFEVIAFFDAYNSLANVTFNHPEYVYPTIHKDSNVIRSKELGHPLVSSTQRVNNDFKIENQQFFIITGANMAGKSTFLRTVSLGVLMANIGLPVCATTFEYTPVKLITSMRTSDSLADDESYFFSELKRLKFIIEEIRGEDYFIVLDEILKGTNSTDKAIGSKKFIEKLVASNSTGIVATHDLSLCEIEKELQEVKNYYFDAEIINDELHFDYKLKEGICQNMNASFLLKKMEIV